VAYFQNKNARLYYEDVGQGDPIIANHGLAEDTTYWSESGVTAALAAKNQTGLDQKSTTAAELPAAESQLARQSGSIYLQDGRTSLQ
jgi:hypothetical protein